MRARACPGTSRPKGVGGIIQIVARCGDVGGHFPTAPGPAAAWLGSSTRRSTSTAAPPNHGTKQAVWTVCDFRTTVTDMTEHEPAPTRTQAQRTAATRARVLDAAIDSLVELGYARTTTQEVNRRAGVSRGALLHHFPTRESLVVAAVGHLVEARMTEILQRPRTGGEDISVIIEAFSGPLFDAALELWVAARTDDALRIAMAPLEQKVSDALTTGSEELFGARYTPDQIALSVELARGLAVSRILRTPDSDRAFTDRVLTTWKDILDAQ